MHSYILQYYTYCAQPSVCVFQSGKLQIFDIGNGALLEEVEAHEGAVWSLSMAPDKVRKYSKTLQKLNTEINGSVQN